MKENILQSLNIMWKGMLAIFIVIGIIVLAVMGIMELEKRVIQKKAQTLADKAKEEPAEDADSQE